MDDYIWLFHNESKRDIFLSVAASLLLHLLLIVVMATTSIFIPKIGKSQKLDIFWLYPPFLYGAPARQAAHITEPPRELKTGPVPKAALTPPSKPVKQPVIEAVPPKEPPPPPVVVEKVEPEPPAEAEMVLPAAEKPEPAAKHEIKPEHKAVVAEAPALKEPAPEKTEKPSIGEALPPAEKGEEPRPAVAGKGSAEPSPAVKELEGATGPADIAKAIPSPETGEGTGPAPGTPQPGAMPGEVAGGPQASIPQDEIKSESKEPPKPETPAETSQHVGIVTPPVFGDMKLTITGKSEQVNGMGISVKFRSYPKSGHNRPMTRAEAGRSTKMVPLHSRPNENTLQAVIVTASDGIYDFILESGALQPVTVDFYLKLYENTGRAATKHIGTRTVTNNAGIARVLMPEGVLWDDDSAFGGNLEDSDSISKFNTETGLFWKEYK